MTKPELAARLPPRHGHTLLLLANLAVRGPALWLETLRPTLAGLEEWSVLSDAVASL